MKKIAAIMTSVFMCSSFLPVSAAQSETVTIPYVYHETFNDTADGLVPSSMVANAKTNKIEVKSVPSESDKSLKFTSSTPSDFYTDISLGGLEDNVVIDFKVRFDKKSNSDFRIYMKNSAGKESEVLRINNSLQLCSPDGTAYSKLTTGKFYKLTVKINTKSGLANYYVRGKERARDILIGGGTFQNISVLRFHSLGFAGGNVYPEFYIDEISVYQSEKPDFVLKNEGKDVSLGGGTVGSSASGIASESAVEDYMGNAAAFYIGQPRMYVDGGVQYVDADNTSAAPYIKEGRTMVPLRAAGEALGADLTYSEKDRSVTVEYEDKTAVFTVDKKTFEKDGEKISLDAAPEITASRVYVPIRAISETFGKKVTYDKCGLVVIADREDFFNFVTDLDVFRKLTGDLCFHAPTGAELVRRIKENFPDNEHPRLYANSDKIAVLRERIKNDANVAKWFESVKQLTEVYFKTDPVVYDIYDGIRLLSICRTARDRMQNLAFCYQMTGETRYADRCIEEMKAVCNFKDWNPYHFLDTSEMTEALSFAYDWLYDYLTPDMRETAKTAIIEKGLNQILEDYRDEPSGRRRTWKWAQSPVADNWNLVCNSGLLQGAMAVAEDVPEIAAEVFDGGLELIKKAVLLYGPDGAWYEGPGYWLYATSYYTDLMCCLDSVFSDTFGYLNVPGIAQTGYYITSITGPCGNFNFHDSDIGSVNSPEIFFLADKLHDAALSNLRMEQMADRGTNGTIRDILYYNPGLLGTAATMQKDYYFRDTEVASFRSDWDDSNSIFLGVHAGKTNVYHGHMDAGSFVLDGFGTRYASDLGADNYNIRDSVWNLYRYRAEGHNTLVINPSKDGGQKLAGAARIDRFESGINSGYAIMDLTDMYKDAESVSRGFKLTNNRSAVIVQDEIKTAEPADIWWFMHTTNDIEVAEDGKSAIVKGKYKNLKVSLLADTPGTFSVMSASPMETSPQNSEQNKNLMYKKLAFHAENVSEITIPILMQFVIPIEGLEENYSVPCVPLSQWTLDETGITQKPVLTSITVDGAELPGFKSDRYVYAYRIAADSEKMPEVKAEGSGEVRFKYTSSVPGYAVITVNDRVDSNVINQYIIKIDKEILKQAPEGVSQLSVKEVKASSVPQPENSPENTLDGDLSTRWSAEGNANIVFDLGESRSVKYLGLAVYQDTTNDGRQQYFDVLVSEDGENYTQVYSGESSGTTLEEEIFPIPETRGRYVKIYCKGTSVGNWNSLTECTLYGN